MANLGNFKFGSSIEGKQVEEHDFVAINKGFAEDANEDAKKFGSLYKGENILGTTEADKLRVTEDIVVTGVSVGNLTNGTTILTGTDVMSVLKSMLVKEIGVTATSPYVVLTGGNPSGVYEKGTVLEPQTYTATLIDGKYTGKSGYSYNQAAGCQPLDVVWSGVTGKSNSEHPYQIVTDSIVIDKPITISAKIVYGDSKNIPVTNLGNPDKSCLIPAGSAVPTSTILYTPQIKWWVGSSTELFDETTWNSDMVRGLNLVAGEWITKKGPITVTFPEGSKQWVIALPANVNFTTKDKTTNFDVTERFKAYTQNVDVVYGNSTEAYVVYVTPINFGATESTVIFTLI